MACFDSVSIKSFESVCSNLVLILVTFFSVVFGICFIL